RGEGRTQLSPQRSSNSSTFESSAGSTCFTSFKNFLIVLPCSVEGPIGSATLTDFGFERGLNRVRTGSSRPRSDKALSSCGVVTNLGGRSSFRYLFASVLSSGRLPFVQSLSNSASSALVISSEA